MKKTILLFLGLAVGFMADAQTQVKTPALSPKAVTAQTVGLTNFEVAYSRPSLKGRELFGGIIRENELWRFGANENTTISFDTPIKFNGTNVKPGTYAMFATPSKNEWVIHLYDNTKNWGTPKKLERKLIVAEVRIPVQKLDNKVETFTISFDNLATNDFIMNIAWENSNVAIKVELPTRELTVESIKEVMAAKPTEPDFFRSASYFLNEEIELESALEYMNKAIDLKGDAPAYYIFTKALILKKLNKTDEAMKAAEETIQAAKKQNYDEYARKGEALLKELK